MQDQALISRQTGLRQVYATRPDEAISLKRAQTASQPKTDALHGTVVFADFPEASQGYGIDRKVGGLGDLPNPGHMICGALAACLDSTIRMIANHLAVEVEQLEVHVHGDVDVRGCMAMDESVRPGFRQLTCTVHLLTAPGTDERLAQAMVSHAERLCVTLDTLRKGVPITVSSELAVASKSA